MSAIWHSNVEPWDAMSADKRSLANVLWRTGNLRYKLDPNQADIYDKIRASHSTVDNSAERIFCMDMSRQVGKDFIMSVLATETALGRMPNADATLKPRSIRIPYAAPTREEVKELIVPTMETLFLDCPPDLQPTEIRKGTFRNSANELSWPWGARIVLVGVDLYPNRLRGPATFAFFFTEPAFVDDLDGLMTSVLLPQMLTQPDGFGVMGSTPPVTPAHTWSTKWLPKARQRRMAHTSTISDCPRFTWAQKEATIKELGGFKSTRVRRELFCEHVVESTAVVVPEYAEVKPLIVVAHIERPKYADTYVSVDPGMSHGTGMLFAWHNFDLACLDIVGDAWLQQKNTRELARTIRAREWQLFGYEPVQPKELTLEAWADEVALMRAEFYPDEPIAEPLQSWRTMGLKSSAFMRVSDTDLRLISDLSTEHSLAFAPTLKDNLDAAVNAFRLRIAGDGTGKAWRPKIRIHKRCVWAQTHFEQALWNKGRTKFAESADGGHFDCLAAGVYLVRMAAWGRNPNPPSTYGIDTRTHHVPPTAVRATGTAKTLMSVFGERRR